MIEINVNGERREIRGWRAALIAVPVLMLVFAVLAAVAFVLFGVALSVLTVLAVVVPLAIVAGVIAKQFGPRRVVSPGPVTIDHEPGRDRPAP